MVRIESKIHKEPNITLGEENITYSIIEKIMSCSRGTFPVTYLGKSIKQASLKKEDW